MSRRFPFLPGALLRLVGGPQQHVPRNHLRSFLQRISVGIGLSSTPGTYFLGKSFRCFVPLPPDRMAVLVANRLQSQGLFCVAPEGVEIPTCNTFSTRKGISPPGDDPVKRESPERVFLGPAKFRSEVAAFRCTLFAEGVLKRPAGPRGAENAGK